MHPLVESGSWNDAPMIFNCIPECGFLVNCFGSGINHTVTYRRVLRPRWNKSPLQRNQLSMNIVGNRTDSKNLLGRSNVIMGRIDRDTGKTEYLSKEFRGDLKGKPSAHGT